LLNQNQRRPLAKTDLVNVTE
jgi:hypothetical protein